MSAPSPCQPELLDAFLDLPDKSAQAEALERHLDQCPRCQRALESKAAQGEFWKTTAQMLAPIQDATLWDKPLCNADQGKAFLRQWLEPSPTAGSLGRLSHYEVQQIIGYGGMGLVVQAEDPELQRCVAIKIVHPHLVGNFATKARFAREARLVASLRHPNIIEIYGIHERDGIPYLVMPLLGGCLSQYVEEHFAIDRESRDTPFDIRQVVSIAKQLADGLSAAHEAGFVHRDIKPSNILVHQTGTEVVISDFGLARALDESGITQTGVIAGTLSFMSPEQAKGEVLDTRTDLFSLGSVLYWLVTGKAPFECEQSFPTLMRIVESRHSPAKDVNSRCPDWFSLLIDMLLEKRPEQRKLDASSLSSTLAQCLKHLEAPGAVRLPEILQRRQTLPVRTSWWILAFGGTLAIIAFCLWMGPNFFRRPQQGTSSTDTANSNPGSADNESPNVPQDSVVTQEKQHLPALFETRQGPLDALDWVNMRQDLRSGTKEDYWLHRLSQLPMSELAPEYFELLEPYLESKDTTLQNLAMQIFAKNPFQEIASDSSLVPSENPFQEISIDESGIQP